MNTINKNIKILTTVSYILNLIMILIICFQYTHPTTITEINESKLKFYSYWYCMDGSYNAMELYYIKYNINMSQTDHDFLSVNLCSDMIYNNLSYTNITNRIIEYSNE